MSLVIGDTPEQLGSCLTADAVMIDGKIAEKTDYLVKGNVFPFKTPSLLKGDMPVVTICEGGFTTQVWFKDGTLTIDGGCDETARVFFEQLFSHQLIGEFNQMKAERDALATQVESLLDDRKAFVKKEFELLKEVERLEIELKKRDEQNAALAAQVEALLECLCSIQQQCIGEIAMSYRLDAENIGQQIYQATGMTEPELRERLKAPQHHLRQVCADAGRDGYLQGHLDALGDPDEIDKEHAAHRARQHADSIRQGGAA